MKTTTNYKTDIPRIVNNSDTDTGAWALEMVNDSIRYLVTKYYFNERSYTTDTVSQQQFYDLPFNIKKIIDLTVSIGGVLWLPKECPSRQYWDALNVIQFYQDFPSFFFVYNSQVGIFPTPASSGNTITMNYKIRLRDLSQDDYTTGTVLAVNGDATVVGTGTAFYADMAGRWIRINVSTTAGQTGDYQWYQIASVTDATHLELINAYTGITMSIANGFTIGEVPILPEDYQDLPLYRMGYIYYTTRFPDAKKAELYQNLYDIGFEALNNEFGSKTTNVVLTDTDAPVYNPNLFVRSLTGN